MFDFFFSPLLLASECERHSNATHLRGAFDLAVTLFPYCVTQCSKLIASRRAFDLAVTLISDLFLC
jgi:hypothetical protein